MSEARPTISDIYYRLGSLESKIDAQSKDLEDYRKNIADRQDKLEVRVTRLETASAKRAGIFVAIAALLSLVGSVAVTITARFFTNLWWGNP